MPTDDLVSKKSRKRELKQKISQRQKVKECEKENRLKKSTDVDEEETAKEKREIKDMKKSKRKSSFISEGEENKEGKFESDCMDIGIKKKRKNRKGKEERGDLPDEKKLSRENKTENKEMKADEYGAAEAVGRENKRPKTKKRKSSDSAEVILSNEVGNSESDCTEKPVKKKKLQHTAQREEVKNDADEVSVHKLDNSLVVKKTPKSKKKSKENENDPVEESVDKADNADVKETPKSKKKKKKLKGNNNDPVVNEESVDKPDDAEVKETPKSKKKKKKSKENDQALLDPEQKADKLASEYLHQWSSDRKSWKFQKVRQVWLLKHMYNSEQVNNDDFEILLLYLDGLKGKSREVTVKQAEKIIEEEDENDETKTKRARQIVQLLC